MNELPFLRIVSWRISLDDHCSVKRNSQTTALCYVCFVLFKVKILQTCRWIDDLSGDRPDYYLTNASLPNNHPPFISCRQPLPASTRTRRPMDKRECRLEGMQINYSYVRNFLYELSTRVHTGLDAGQNGQPTSSFLGSLGSNREIYPNASPPPMSTRTNRR